MTQINNGEGGGVSRHSALDIFKISAHQLKALFVRDGDKNVEEQALNLLNNELRGTDYILKCLQTEANSGIMGDQADIRRRQLKFGANEKPKPQRIRWCSSFREALNDRLLVLVAIFAIISIIPGMIIHPATGWLEGCIIFAALIIQVLISSYNDFTKDTKFIELQSLNRDETIPVIRGKRGSMQTVSIWDLVVGDIIQMGPGDKVPADCLVTESANLRVKESTTWLNDEDETVFQWHERPKSAFSPFLFTDSFVIGGTCKAVVVAVGANTQRGIEDTKFDITQDQTDLTNKLDNIGGSLKFIGLISSFVILGVSMAVLLIQTTADERVGGGIFMDKLVANIVISLIMLIVAVPEGLPMTVLLSLAHSVLQMSKYDNILVRDINSVEQVGLITDLCLGKTGTMTTEKMEVVNFYTQNIFVKNSRKNTLLNCELDNQIIEKIVESVVFNSQAHIEMTENSFYEAVGNGTEVSLIKWLQDAEIPVHEYMQKKEGRVYAQVPFDSKLKRSIIAVHHPELQDYVRVYIKGAPEIVLKNCTSHYKSGDLQRDGTRYAEKVPLSQHEVAEIKQKVMDQQMTYLALRPIAFSYCDIEEVQFNQILNRMQGDVDTEHEIALLERDQTLLAVVGLKDPVRPAIKDVVQQARAATINLRIVSGDNLHTTTRVAYDVGILTDHEYDIYSQGNQQVAMDASLFRDAVGDVIRTEEEGNAEQKAKGETVWSYRLSEKGQENFNQLIVSLKVLGRAEPEDKLRLVAGLRGMTEDLEQEAADADEDGGENPPEVISVPTRKVAVVGEGINDIEAFNAAHVSFALQDGSSMARNNASMVLQTNDFDSCMRAVMWGRNVYMNVQRFLQFQITANFTVLIVVIVSYVTLTESALNPVELIYVNLIMDIFGALALAATRPQTDLVNFGAGQGRLMTPYMYRQIFGVTIYMIAIMMVIMYCGKSIFDLDYNLSTQIIDRDDPLSKPKRKHFTLIWNTFIFLQVFNLVNCRDVGPDKLHGCSGLQRNLLTVFVIILIVLVQTIACFTFLGQIMFQTEPVDRRHFIICVVCGCSVMLASTLFKLIPNKWIENRMPMLDENKSIGGGSKLMAAYQNQANAKAFNRKKTDAADGEPVKDYDSQESLNNYADDDDFRAVR